MEFRQHSHSNAEGILKSNLPYAKREIEAILHETEPFPHGKTKGKTARKSILEAFAEHGWQTQVPVDLATKSHHTIDLLKWSVAVEVELSRFEMVMKELFKFMVLYARGEIELGLILTLDDAVFESWRNGVPSHKGVRASLAKTVDFLESDMGKLVQMPIWCIGIR